MQTRVFTWGKNTDFALGLSSSNVDELGGHPRGERYSIQKGKVGLPTEMDGTKSVGVVADLQCGGWSTTLLNSTGQLYAVGTFNGLRSRPQADPRLSRLRFPPGYAQSGPERYEPSTAIKQYSCGRIHVLGLSDSGKIWQWDHIKEPAMHIKFLHTDLVENGPRGAHGTTVGVVAGWDRASAYVLGTGIVYWDPNVTVDADVEGADGLLIDAAVVPGTGFQRSKYERPTTLESDEQIGEVRKHIVLEGYIVFITDLNKVFAVKSDFPNDGVHRIVELTTFGIRVEASHAELQDLQGTFRNFAVFTSRGNVLTADHRFLGAFWEDEADDQDIVLLPRPKQIPVLQHNGVISLAFGDYHSHALHSNGQISSLGTEPQGCGALGLGLGPEGSIFRGVRFTHYMGDGRLVREASHHARHIWFEPEKNIWLRHMAVASRHPEASARHRMVVSSERVAGELSEWFEQEGRGWDDFQDVKDADDSGLGAYFALSVAAAGWHSGALVLVDEKRAEKVREKYIIERPDPPNDNRDDAADEVQPSMISRALEFLYESGRSFLGLGAQIDGRRGGPQAPDIVQGQQDGDIEYTWRNQPFPRIRLSTGEEMPGSVPLSRWRYGVPHFGTSRE